MLLPLPLITRAWKVLLPDSVVFTDHVFAPTLLVAVAQVEPPSKETWTLSPVTRLADRVPLTVWPATLVTKSPSLLPVSCNRAAVATVVAGGALGSVMLLRTMLSKPHSKTPPASAVVITTLLTPVK